jgi:hypothetical protein
MSIPIKDTGKRIVLATPHFASGQKGTSVHMGKTSTKGGGQSTPPYIPNANSLPLDLDWSRSEVHNLLNWLKDYPLGEGVVHKSQWTQQESRQRSQKYRQLKWQL